MIKVFVKYQEIEKELEFPGGAEVKSLSAIVGDTRNAGLIPGSRRSPGEGQPTPVFLPGEPHGQGSLMGYSL